MPPSRRCLWLVLVAAVLAVPLSDARATETENQTIRILPAPGKVVIDAQTNDWDLSGGIFACGEVEHLRDRYAVWFHAMWDADNVYLLARWNDDTPLNNPERFGGHGFNADCLQVRFIMFPDTPDKTVSWWDFWRDVQGRAVAARGWPGPRNGVSDNKLDDLPNAAEQGVQQAFRINDDGKGYVQEVSIPWALLSVAGRAPKAGERLKLTIEPNFTAGSFGRITIKDIFDARVAAPDRIFTFRAYADWGWATLEPKGNVVPQPVRLADGRTFAVAMRDGVPVVDWTGLIRKFEWPGFLPVSFTVPFDGFVSLVILDRNGVVVRHLLNCDERAKGEQTVQWDGLTDPTYRTPGQPVPAGEYTWKAIVHPGAKLTFRGAATGGGRVPWQGRPEDFWLGDHGVPSAVVTDGERMYLACNGAEGGRHLLATDFDGNFLWGLQNTTGLADPESIAVGGGSVYVLHPKSYWVRGGGAISRVDAATGGYAAWPGTTSHILQIADVWPKDQPGPDHFDAIAVLGGKLYASAADPAFFVEDITDWKEMVRALRRDNPLAKRVMAQADPRTLQRLDQFLDGKVKQEQAFATWLGGPRFDTGVIAGLNALLAAADVAPNTEGLSAAARARANRAAIEAAFAPAVRPLAADRIHEIDVATRAVTRSWTVPFAGALAAAGDRRLLVVSGGTQVLALALDTGATTPLVSGLTGARAVATDAAGNIYVSVGAPDMQVIVFDPQGRETARIGRKGGHRRVGPWQPDGMIDPAGVAVDKFGKLWVMEHYEHPKRVSIWNVKTGALIKDFFGPTHYGASGAAINPRDPDLMVGEGVEWRMDPATGTSVCVGAFDTRYHQFATFREGSNGSLYLYTNTMRYGNGSIQVWERLGDANYALRAEVRNDREGQDKSAGMTEVWTDLNGDGKEQPDELQRRPGALFCAGSNSWSLNLGPDLTLYGLDRSDNRLKALPVTGFTAGGAPKYDLASLRVMPAAMSQGYQINYGCAMPSQDNRTMLVNLRVKDHPADLVWCGFDLATGKLLWTYPNPYFQVHGSHKAPAPEMGLFRGAYGPVGAVSVKGAGGFWIINGNLGEWNALTSDGFFLTRLFSGNIFEWEWPEKATPGVDMSRLPPGCGGEDFGGSVTQARDGRLYVQAGKLAVWNLLLSGLDQTEPIPGGNITVTVDDTRKALALRERALQAAAAGRKIAARKLSVRFTGDLNADFRGGEFADYQKSEDARVRTVVAHDDTTLFLGWDVRDATPWVNGARDISQMYASGDTVDFQLGTDPSADPKRSGAARGDLRLSIGNFGGKPTAVLYRFVSAEKKPRAFSSGVIQGYQVDYVDVVPEAQVRVRVDRDRYVVEAAVPLAALGLALRPGLELRGDFGVTHADPTGMRTKLRTYWSNQQTGLVDDIVFELQLSPQNWGTIVFE